MEKTKEVKHTDPRIQLSFKGMTLQEVQLLRLELTIAFQKKYGKSISHVFKKLAEYEISHPEEKLLDKVL